MNFSIFVEHKKIKQKACTEQHQTNNKIDIYSVKKVDSNHRGEQIKLFF